MITFYQHIEEIKKAYKISDAAQIASLKRWYNKAAKKVKNNLRRGVNREQTTADTVEGQRAYQLPEYVSRVHNVVYIESSTRYPLEEVKSEARWNELNMGGEVTGTPEYYRIQGDDELLVWPAPASDVEDGLEVSFSPKHPNLTADDVTTGTATVTNDSETVTLSSSVVDTKWVGRWFATTDGSHEHWYKINGYVSNTSFTLENYHAGDSGAGRTYIVGDIVDIPEEYVDLPMLFTVSRYLFIYRKNRVLAKDIMQEFKDGLDELNQDYATNTKSRVVKANRHNTRQRPYPPWWPMTGLEDA